MTVSIETIRETVARQRAARNVAAIHRVAARRPSRDVVELAALQAIADGTIDTWSSGSRQHYIETGQYLTVAEAEAYAVPHPAVAQ